MNLVVLLSCPSLAVVGCCCLELDTLKGDDVGIRCRCVAVDVPSSTDRSWAGSNLWSFVALRGMLDQFDHFFAMLDMGSNADHESMYLQQFIVPL